MAKKRTKADKLQRNIERLEDRRESEKLEERPPARVETRQDKKEAA